MFGIRALRVLTTDICNYNCIYCHNEGQPTKNSIKMKIEDFKIFMQQYYDSELKQVWFSGGEPFLNSDTIKMIEWMGINYPECRLGCATNASLLNEDIIKVLSKFNVKLNINFPSLNQCEYERTLRCNMYFKVIENLRLLNKHNVKYVLNFVLKNETLTELDAVINFAISQKCGLKILPYTSPNGENEIFKLFNIAKNKLDKIADKNEIDEESQNYFWYKNVDNTVIRFRTYENPCYTKNHKSCKDRTEMRLLPNFTIKFCLIGNVYYPLNLQTGDIRKDIYKAWKNFTDCSAEIIQ